MRERRGDVMGCTCLGAGPTPRAEAEGARGPTAAVVNGGPGRKASGRRVWFYKEKNILVLGYFSGRFYFSRTFIRSGFFFLNKGTMKRLIIAPVLLSFLLSGKIHQIVRRLNTVSQSRYLSCLFICLFENEI